jgi:ribosomal protein S18 acetylase RimI-like enzyme
MTVRAAVAGDRDAIGRCLRSDATFRADEIDVALALVDAALGGDPEYVVLVQDDDRGGVCGYTCVGATPMTLATWDLYWIVVDAGARGRGVGRGLLAAAEALVRARGGRHIRIETGSSAPYAAARALYARAGYPHLAQFADFYAPGDAMIVYYKEL